MLIWLEVWWYPQDIKCRSYQLAVQSLSADTKLHALFDKTHHEGKNLMDYKVPHLDSTLKANAALSDISVLEEEDVNNSYSDQDKADQQLASWLAGSEFSKRKILMIW